MNDVRRQAITGLVPPLFGEALIREAWPSVTAIPAAAGLGRALMRSIVLAPLGWALLLPVYFMKILPFIARRYTLTNRRLMVQRGLRPSNARISAMSSPPVRMLLVPHTTSAMLSGYEPVRCR